jgi:hypothetical protein
MYGDFAPDSTILKSQNSKFPKKEILSSFFPQSLDQVLGFVSAGAESAGGG